MLLIVTACAALALPLLAQTSAAALQTAPPAKPLAYEVVSIKPHKSLNDPIWWRPFPDGFSATGITLKMVIMNAYALVMPEQIVGLPGWADSNKFDIQAKMDEDTTAALQKLPPKERRQEQNLMMQSMLADRFQLKVHRETRELPVYDLVIAKDGLKMQAAPAGVTAGYVMYPSWLKGKAVRIDSFAYSLSNVVGRMVVNKTGLTGSYAIALKWTPDGQQESADSGPSIFAAVEEQLGLKLVPAKGPVDTIVVDHVEKPSPN